LLPRPFEEAMVGFETFEKRSILVKVKPPAGRAYGPEGKARISTTGIY